MSEWMHLLPAFAAAISVLLIPGVAIGVLFKFRGLNLWALSAPISMSVIALSSLALSFVHVSWSLLGVLGVGTLIWLLVFVFQRLIFPRVFSGERLVLEEQVEEKGSASRGVVEAGAVVFVCLAAVVMTVRITEAIGSPDNISQTFDNIFHLNAVRFILDTGDASPLKIGLMNSPAGNLGFYPSGWHALVSIVAQLSGANVVVATNAVIIAVGGAVWLPGVVFLVRKIFGKGIIQTISAVVVAGASQAFPYFLVGYGVLYPMYLGFAMVPAALAIVVTITSRYVAGKPGYESNRELAGYWLLFFGLLPGLAVVHPGAMMGLLCASVPVVTTWFLYAFRAARWQTRKNRIVVSVIFLLYLILGFVLFLKVRPPRSQATWQAVVNHWQAIWGFITQQLTESGVPLLFAVVLAAGIIFAVIDVVRRCNATSVMLLGGYLIAFVMFFIVASVQNWGVRFWALGIWYQNIPRVEAITLFFTVPIAAYGMIRLLTFVSDMCRKKGWGNNAAILVVTAVLLFVGVQSSPALTQMLAYVNQSYVYDKNSPLVDTEELALLERIPREVPAGVRIAGNGWTGAGMAYAISGRPVTMPHVMIDFTPDGLEINDHLRDAVPGSKVCAAAKRLNVGYVLDFGEREVHGGRHIFPGLENLKDSHAVKLIDYVGHAKLYKLVGCSNAKK